jgi:hypothetical protein
MQPPAHRNTAATSRGADPERTRALHRDPALPHDARHDVERALDLLQPTIEAAIADRDVSHDQSLVIVVVDPEAPAGGAFEDAILVQREFGRAGRVDVDYARYALDKARASFRERCDTSLLRERGGALLSADLALVGGLHRRGWTIGVSGALPVFDEAIGAMLVDLVIAIQSQRAAHAAAPPAKE